MAFMSTSLMAWIAGVGIAAFLGVIVYAISAPSKQHDPQRGVAVGCLMLLAVPAVLLAIVLGIGIAVSSRPMVSVAFWFVAAPAAYLLMMLVVINIMKLARRKDAWPADSSDDITPAEPS